MPPTNKAAVLLSFDTPFKVQHEPYTPPRAREIVIKNAAIAINPYDGSIQQAGNIVTPWLKTPFILGTDVAGEVVEVGKDVKRFQVGDRVVGNAVGLYRSVCRACEGGFQNYTVLRQQMTSRIPHAISFERAAVLPLGLSTAAVAVFHKHYLALNLPSRILPIQSASVSASVPKLESGKGRKGILLVWGASSSVGSNALQLAAVAGYWIVATASPHNHSYLRSLGGDAILDIYDYRSPSVVEDLIAIFRTNTSPCVGAVAIGPGSFDSCVRVMKGIEKGKGRKYVVRSTLDLPPLPGKESSRLQKGRFVVMGLGGIIGSAVESRFKGVKEGFVNSEKMLIEKEGVDSLLGESIWGEWLEGALESGVLRPAPEPEVFRGLEQVEKAVDMCRKGLSGRKVVVVL
jgi:NADPH:quinone reductase-like Zn-dependent oxidoreductase